jgi:hypothetical protein
MSSFTPDPLEIALATEYLNARQDTRTQDLPPIQGAKANDAFNRSLDLDVLDKPTGKAPEPADVPAWQQPLCATREGMKTGELVNEGTGLSYYTTAAGDGKVNGMQPLALTKKGPHTAAEVAEIKRVQMRQP